MNRVTSCRSTEHLVSRRALLGGFLGGAAGLLGGRFQDALAKEMQRHGKRLLIVFQAGGLSQLESWDPKPGTDTGGPCLPIPTSVPGIHISEWLPHTARVMHHLFVLRGMSTGESNHGPAAYLMMSGRREGAALVYPHLACVANKFLTPPDHPVPGYVSVGGWGGPEFLGPQYGPVDVKVNKPPDNLDVPAAIAPDSEARRQDFRRLLNRGFTAQRGSAQTDAYVESFEQAQKLMRNKRLFDHSKEDPRQIDRYGRHEMGRQCVLALRLLEKGVTCVQVGHAGYDTHAENFNVHFDLLEQFDRPFACLIADLAERGMLDDTVVVCMGEFGRTPYINHRFGRDHWSGSWSCVLAGARFPRGAVHGKTNANGTEVIEGKVEAAPLFHTLLKSLGIRSTQSHTVHGERVPIGDPAFAPIDALLT